MSSTAGNNVAPTPNARNNAEQPSVFATVIRMIVIWYSVSSFFGKKQVPKDQGLIMSNAFTKGEDLDLWVYISEKENFQQFEDENSLVWYESEIKYAVKGPSGERSLSIDYKPSENLQNNGSAWAHIFFARSGYSPNPKDSSYKRSSTFGISYPLIAYRRPPKIDRRKNLLGGSITKEGEEAEREEANLKLQQKVELKVESGAGREEDDELEGSEPEFDNEAVDGGPLEEFISYWKPNLTIALVEDFTKYTPGQVPDPLREVLRVDLESGQYFPTVVVHDFWLLKEKLIPVNATVDRLPLHLSLSPLPLWLWNLYAAMDKSFQQQEAWGALEGESDSIKRVFLEGNPVLLAITLVVSLLHTVFDFLSFKNDIQFWNQNKSMEGLSARTIVLNFFCQLIIFLYLLDNETSWMIILSSGASVCIEFWKIGKAMHVTLDRSGRFPMLRFSNRESYVKSKTREYDEMATKYLSYALFPLIFCYAIYSLLYETHKSWYSWLLATLTGCVYTFGFIMMCPQLFINYKLKSVAHLPWRQMTYKFLNTIIDDLFAFVIKMPLLHRLSVFRDDVIFLIYLYQRWIYPVDKKRVNEFGYGGPEAASEGDQPQSDSQPQPEPQLSLQAKEGEELPAGTSEGQDKVKVGVSEEGLAKRKGSKGKK